jgi:hypothetical protein
MKNRVKVFKIAMLLLVLALVSTVMISGTLAKYTSEYSGQDTARVARWSFGAESGQKTDDLKELSGSGTQDLALFDHKYDQHINQKDGDDYIIAPGVDGEFILQMSYLADVDADVEITIEKADGSAEVPVKYSVDGIEWVGLEDLAEEIADSIVEEKDFANDLSPEVAGKFRISKVDTDDVEAHEIAQTVKWKWDYSVDTAADTTDTALGEASADAENRIRYDIKITLKATQVTHETAAES